MKKALLLCSFGLCSLLALAQFPHSGTIATTDPTFNRPDPGNPPTAISSQGVGVFYNVVPLTITTTGLVTITSSSTTLNFDLVGFLYGLAGFDPLNPLTNVLAGDDDSGPGTLNFALTYNFTTPGTYYIVVTTLKAPLTGNYTLSITEPGPLPVRLVSFTAEKSTSGSLLKWTSAEETGISSYEVQHSADGVNFKDIFDGTVKALNAATNSNYSYLDANPYQKLNYYRLKIAEKTGATSFSTIALVNNSKNSNKMMAIFPNPTASVLRIQPATGQNGKATVAVLSGAGQIVYKSNYTFYEGSIVTLNLKRLSAGSYVVRVRTADGLISNLRFVKY